ncbi:MAG TPA: GNAT family N-acetyltransferase [Steroidobacteraceae bacterium]
MTAPPDGPDLPPGPAPGRYPVELERDWEPAGGPTVHIRALQPDDLQRELRFIQGLSRETLYLRMQYFATQVSERDLERLLDLDYVDRMAIAGMVDTADGQSFVGVCRYARIAGTTRAECAVVVADDWQARGLGTELMRSLGVAARARGITSLEGSTLAENQRIGAWARRFGFNVRTEPHSGGLVNVTLDLETLPS